jgi:hypothetical protein
MRTGSETPTHPSLRGPGFPGAALPSSLTGLLTAARARQDAVPSALFDHAEVTLEISHPTIFVFWGDWHLGAEGTDYTAFETDLQALRFAKSFLQEQLQVIAMGDYIDGYLPSGTPKNPTQLLSPREQRAAAVDALKLVDPLVVLEGDHDGWHSKQDVEYAWLHEASMASGWNYAQWGTRITIQPEDGPERVILARHRFKGSRATDILRPHKNLHLELGPAEIVALAHVHSNPGVYRTMAKRVNEGEFTAVQSGTYKVHDEYAKRLGGYTGAMGVPAVIIDERGHIHPHNEYLTALEADL